MQISSEVLQARSSDSNYWPRRGWRFGLLLMGLQLGPESAGDLVFCEEVAGGELLSRHANQVAHLFNGSPVGASGSGLRFFPCPRDRRALSDQSLGTRCYVLGRCCCCWAKNASCAFAISAGVRSF